MIGLWLWSPENTKEYDDKLLKVLSVRSNEHLSSKLVCLMRIARHKIEPQNALSVDQRTFIKILGVDLLLMKITIQ